MRPFDAAFPTGSRHRRTCARQAGVVLSIAVGLSLAWPTLIASGVECFDPSFISNGKAKLLVLEYIDALIWEHPEYSGLMAASYPYPLEPNTLVEPWCGDCGSSMELEGCAWFFYLDLIPEDKFASPTVFMLVGGDSLDPDVAITFQSWGPRVEGIGELYHVPEEYVTSPDVFHGEFPVIPAGCDAPPPEDPGPPSSEPTVGHSGRGDRDADRTEKKWAILLDGAGIWQNDRAAMKAALTHKNGADIDEANIKDYPCGLEERLMDGYITEANNAQASQVYLYISAEGAPDGDLQCWNQTNDPDQTWMTPQELAGFVSQLKACSVIVIIDACHSGAHLEPVYRALRERELDEFFYHFPPDIEVYTSASAEKTCGQGDDDPSGVSAWTRQLVKYWKKDNVDLFQAFYKVVLDENCPVAKKGDPDFYVGWYLDCANVPVEPISWGVIKSLYR